MLDQTFRRRESEQRTAWISELAGRLVDAGTDAVDVLREECRTSERAGDRLRTAHMLLTLGLRFRQTHELEERLRLVEERLGLVDPSDDEAGEVAS